MQRHIQVSRDATTRKPLQRSSDLTDRLADALERSVSERAGRMERLIQEFAGGRYQTDLPALSKAILEEMQATGHEAPDT
jgi:hypothetical protein